MYQSYNPSLNTSFTPSTEQQVLQQFYEERKKRVPNLPKRHSLLQKNASYFSNASAMVQDADSLVVDGRNSRKEESCQGSQGRNQIGGRGAIKEEVKGRKLGITHEEILRKYSQGKENYFTTGPSTPTGQSAFRKDKGQDAVGSKRKRNLQELQANFKILTGQEPQRKKSKDSHPITSATTTATTTSHASKSNTANKYKEERIGLKIEQREIQKMEQLVAKLNQRKKQIEEQKPKTGENHKKSNTNLKEKMTNIVCGESKNQNNPGKESMNDSIKIVNKVRSHSMKPCIEQGNELVSIKDLVENNSFRQKDKDDEPLLVLAQQYACPQFQNNDDQPSSEYDIQTDCKSKYTGEDEGFVASPNFKMNTIKQEEQERRDRTKSNKVSDSRVSTLKESRPGLANSRNSHCGYIRQVEDTEHDLSADNLDNSRSTQYKIEKTKEKERERETDKQRQREKREQMRRQQMQKHIKQLTNKVQQLQKINKKQNKFIESVQSMRKSIQKTQTACNLKQLWRWIKALPTN